MRTLWNMPAFRNRLVSQRDDLRTRSSGGSTYLFACETRAGHQSLSRSHVIVICTSSPLLSFVTGGFRISLFPENSKNR